MLKKEYFFIFALIGLAIAYVFFSLLVIFTGGKWGRVVNKKLMTGAMIVAFCAVLNTGNIGYSQVTDPTLAPTPVYGTLAPPVVNPTYAPVYGTAIPEPTATPDPGATPDPEYHAGNVWIEPVNQTVKSGSIFQTEIHVCSDQKVSAYGFDVTYNEALISVERNYGVSGVEEGEDGFLSAVNSTEPGIIKISGFDVSGQYPGNDLRFLIIYWSAGSTEGTVPLDISVDTLVNEETNPIGDPTGIGGTVIISNVTLGDVNSDGVIDIVDALLTSQHYVGLNPPDVNPGAADVDASGLVDIVDALLIAQKYVGLIDKFPGE